LRNKPLLWISPPRSPTASGWGGAPGLRLLVVRNDRLVVFLHLGEEPVAVLRENVPRADDAEHAVLAQQRGRLLVAALGSDPVEGGEGNHSVELRLQRFPGLEGGGDDLNTGKVRQLAPRQSRKPFSQFDAGDLVAALCDGIVA
jgi:hypothetical protein